jgi:hypothetical protein
MSWKKNKKKDKNKNKAEPKLTLTDLDEEEITTMRIEHPLQVLRGFKDKVTEDPKKRKKLIKGVSWALLDPSFLPYSDQYSENVAKFLAQLTSDEVNYFYKGFDEAFGKIVGDYENIISSMFKNKMDWKKALVREESVSAKILDALFNKKAPEEESPEAEKVEEVEEATESSSSDLPQSSPAVTPHTAQSSST